MYFGFLSANASEHTFFSFRSCISSFVNHSDCAQLYRSFPVENYILDTVVGLSEERAVF